ncbi:DUF7802 domain-containing protein [Enhygromyxa salina]|nr:hypothetical protein [Enhygromyxa salina]
MTSLLQSVSSPELPWHHFTSPLEKWAVQPSFVLGEYLFMICAALALVHAWREGRDHLLIWVAALITGTANDMIFMALPLVDNFWQAQAQVMITARLPLYIPCVYVCFMYYPTVAVRRLGLKPLALAALTGIVGCLFYAPYDIVGAKFLWWTWHDTDAPVAMRLLGAPVASSLWVLTFVASFSWLIDRALARSEKLTAKSFGLGLALVAGCTTLLMMVQMTILQQLDGGSPGYLAFGLGLATYAAIVIWQRKPARPEPARPGDRLLLGAAIAYFATLTGIMATFDPATHVNTGVHQTVGECYVEATDVTGLTRYEFLCVSDFDEDYSFECVDELPAEGSEWYTVCGRPHEDFAAWMSGVGLLGLAGIGLFTLMLGSGRQRLRVRNPDD